MQQAEVKEFMPWKEEYSVGVSSIDAQHKVLVKMINQLHEAMREGKGRAALEGIIREMSRYSQVHFGYEEKLFEQYGYPEKNSTRSSTTASWPS